VRREKRKRRGVEFSEIRGETNALLNTISIIAKAYPEFQVVYRMNFSVDQTIYEDISIFID